MPRTVKHTPRSPGCTPTEGTMPRVKLNPDVKEIHGTLFDVVFKLSPKGNQIITRKPDMSNVEWSDAQVSHRQRFSLASAYAQAALADPQLGAQYKQRAQELHKRPRDLAISDYMKGRAVPVPPAGEGSSS